MSGVDGSRGVYEVGTALEDNSDIQLRSIDLSNNKLGEVCVDTFVRPY